MRDDCDSLGRGVVQMTLTGVDVLHPPKRYDGALDEVGESATAPMKSTAIAIIHGASVTMRRKSKQIWGWSSHAKRVPALPSSVVNNDPFATVM